MTNFHLYLVQSIHLSNSDDACILMMCESVMVVVVVGGKGLTKSPIMCILNSEMEVNDIVRKNLLRWLLLFMVLWKCNFRSVC